MKKMIKLRVLIYLAYIPTAILLSAIVLGLIAYLLGWRFLVIPVPPDSAPVPEYRIMAGEPFWWN